MDIHEFQAKELLQKKGVPTPPFFIASSMEEVESILKKNNLNDCIVKVQIHAGGRGKAGGVRRGKSQKEILEISRELLGMKIVNEQTGPDGLVANKIMLCYPVDIVKEYYLAATIDRDKRICILLTSRSGGMEVEKAHETIIRTELFSQKSLPKTQFDHIARALGWTGQTKEDGINIITAIRDAFFYYDATLVEINPLALDKDGRLSAIDAKVTLDEDALFRHPDLALLDDPSQRSPDENEAKSKGLAFVHLDGTIGCMVNGAGLAMATIDLISERGGKAANFLDVGGLSTTKNITYGFDILLSEKPVKVIFINLYSGINDCASIAELFKNLISAKKPKIPLVIRLEGNKSKEGKEILANAALDIVLADTIGEGVEKVVKISKKV